MSSKLRMVSVVLLTLLGAVTLLGSLASVANAFSRGPDLIGPVSIEELAAGRGDLEVALRGRRVTAAAFAAGYALLFLAVVLVPYRRGDVWAWWALFVTSLVLGGIILLRLPLLGLGLGAAVGWTQLVLGCGALMLDVGRLRRS